MKKSRNITPFRAARRPPCGGTQAQWCRLEDSSFIKLSARQERETSIKHLNRRDNGPLIERLMCEMWWCLLILLAINRRHILEIAGKLPQISQFPIAGPPSRPLVWLFFFSCSFLLLLVRTNVLWTQRYSSCIVLSKLGFYSCEQTPWPK